MDSKKALEFFGKALNERNFQRKIRDTVYLMKSLTKSTLPNEKKVKFKAGNTWEINLQKKEITYCPMDLIGKDEKYVLGGCLHELSHFLFTDILEIQSQIFDELSEVYQKPYEELVNAVEDIRIERKMRTLYPGTFDNFYYMSEDISNNYDSPEKVEEYQNSSPEHRQFLSLMRADEYRQPRLAKNSVIDKYTELKISLVKAWNAKNVKDVEKIISEEVWNEYVKLLPPPTDKNNGKQPKKNENNEPDENEKPEEGQGTGSPPKINILGGSTIQKEGNSLEGNSSSEMPKTLPTEEELTSSPEDKQKHESMEDFLNRVEKEEEKRVEEDLSNEEESNSNNNSKNKGLDWGEPTPRGKFKGNSVRREIEPEDYKKIKSSIANKVSYFTRKLSSIMIDNKLERWGGNYRTGRLENRKLYKLATGSNKLFSRKVCRQNKDYAISIIVDESGSMTGGNETQAMRATCLLSETLAKCGIPFEIIGFNESTRQYKMMGSTFNNMHKRNIAKIYRETHYGDCGGTNMGYPINVAGQHLLQEHGQKFMLVITDGESNDGGRDVSFMPNYRKNEEKPRYGDYRTEREIAAFKDKCNIFGIGIGGGCNYVKHVFPEYLLCKDVTELPDKMISIIKKKIKRG